MNSSHRLHVPFRFLDLPGLIKENILKRVDLLDVVSLSLCSSRAANCISSLLFANLRDPEGPLSGGGVHVEITKKHVSVVFQDQQPKCSLRVQNSEGVENYKDLIYSPKYRTENRLADPRKRPVGPRPRASNVEFDPTTVLETHLIADHSSSYWEAAKRAVEHICFIFRIPVVRVSVDVHEIPKFTSLFIWDFLQGSCSDVQLHGGTIQDWEMNKFFENFRIEKRLSFNVFGYGDLRKLRENHENFT